MSNTLETGILQFTKPTYKITESGNWIGGQVTVSRTGGSQGTASVKVTVRSESGTAGKDLGKISIILTWADGEEGEKYVPINVVQDAYEENDETVLLTLSSIKGAKYAPVKTAQLIIVDRETTAIASNLVTDDTLIGLVPVPGGPKGIRFQDLESLILRDISTSSTTITTEQIQQITQSPVFVQNVQQTVKNTNIKISRNTSSRILRNDFWYQGFVGYLNNLTEIANTFWGEDGKIIAFTPFQLGGASIKELGILALRDSLPFKCKMAIYSDNNGVPGQRLFQSQEIVYTTSADWTPLTTGIFPQEIEADDFVWCALKTDSKCKILGYYGDLQKDIMGGQSIYQMYDKWGFTGYTQPELNYADNFPTTIDSTNLLQNIYSIAFFGRL